MNLILSVLYGLAFQCRHEHTWRPMNNRERCGDCGRSRSFAFSHNDIVRGKWEVDEQPEPRQQQVYHFEVAED